MRTGFSLAVRPFPPTGVPFVYADLTCENVSWIGIDYTFEPTAQNITLCDREFD